MTVDCLKIPMRARGMEKSVPIYAHDNVLVANLVFYANLKSRAASP